MQNGANIVNRIYAVLGPFDRSGTQMHANKYYTSHRSDSAGQLVAHWGVVKPSYMAYNIRLLSCRSLSPGTALFKSDDSFPGEAVGNT